MNIFVTGSGGQLGQAIQRTFSNHVLFPFTHAQLDITDIKAIRTALTQIKCDLVINAAAYNNVDKAETEVQLATLVNEIGPKNVAMATAEKNIPLVHISTDYVFDGKKGSFYNESDSVGPLSAYGRSKWAGEDMVRKINPRHYVVRTSWLYDHSGDNFFKKVIRTSGQKPLKLVNDQISSPTYAPHLAMALQNLINGKPFGLYHISNNGSASRYDQFKLYLSTIKLDLPIIPVSHKEFTQVAVRPAFSALTTMRGEHFKLPPWQEGVIDYVKDLKRKNG